MRTLLTLLESIELQEAVNPEFLTFLKQQKFTNVKVRGNNIFVMISVPTGAKKKERVATLTRLLELFIAAYPELKPHYSIEKPNISSLGYIQFIGDPTKVIVKDIAIQGDNSAGVKNEIGIAHTIQDVIKNHGYANVTFIDPRGTKLEIDGVTGVEISGRAAGTRKKGGDVKKADVVLTSPDRRLPVSIKEISAESWESADTMFGARARVIIDKLVKDKIVELIEISPGNYKLSKEIVVEPTEEEALRAIFGSDINPDGGIVVQTFKPEHYTQVETDITVNCHAVIKNRDDIPDSHLMVWLLRNNSGRLSKAIGIRGIRPIASVMHRAIGKGNKNVVLVDKDGNIKQSMSETTISPVREKRTFSPMREKRS
jgi:hypothetical protein